MKALGGQWSLLNAVAADHIITGFTGIVVYSKFMFGVNLLLLLPMRDRNAKEQFS